MSKFSLLPAFSPSLIITGLALLLTACQQGENSGAAKVNPYGLMEGEAIYKAECASCHGKNLEGEANWNIRKADGKLPAPPHDANGHTWHHPFEQLFAITKFGMVPPNAPEGYVSDMPAYKTKLTDQQIRNVLHYIESRWSDDIHKLRAERFKAS